MEFDKLDSKTSANAVHVTTIVLAFPGHGSEAQKSTLPEQQSCIWTKFGHQEPWDAKALEKEHKNLDSGPFSAHLGPRLYTRLL
jgi:hypothetical protein